MQTFTRLLLTTKPSNMTELPTDLHPLLVLRAKATSFELSLHLLCNLAYIKNVGTTDLTLELDF